MPKPEIVERLRPDWLRTSAHESGHAVIALVVGIPVDRARVWYAGAGRNVIVLGMMFPGRRGGPPAGPARADAQLVMALAGPAAEVMWSRRHDHMSAGAAQREADGWCAGDLANARAAVRDGAELTLIEGRARARELVRAHWSGIERTAAQLARQGVIPGSSVQV